MVGHTYQLLEEVNPRTYIGSGKVGEVMRAVEESGAETVIFDDELSPGKRLQRGVDGAAGQVVVDLRSQKVYDRWC